ncbi:hypothetical protein BDN72DRAFT_865877, partial [Pluteus cervinus]
MWGSVKCSQKLLLKNLHIRYECMDAKDDYYAQLKSGGTAFPTSAEYNYDNTTVWTMQDYTWEVPEGSLNEFHDLLFLGNPGQKLAGKCLYNQGRIKNMTDMLEKMKWTTVNPDLLPKDLDLDVEPVTSNKVWKDEVAICRQKVLDERMEQMAKSLAGSGISLALEDIQ